MFSPFFFIAVLFTAAEAKSHGTDKRSLRRPTPWSLQKKIIVFGGAAAGTTAVLVTGGILFYVYYPSNPAKSSVVTTCSAEEFKTAVKNDAAGSILADSSCTGTSGQECAVSCDTEHVVNSAGVATCTVAGKVEIKSSASCTPNKKTTLPIKITMQIGWSWPKTIKKWTRLTEKVSESMKNTLASKLSSPVTSFSVNVTFVDEEKSAAGRYLIPKTLPLKYNEEKPRNLVAIFEIKDTKETPNLMKYIDSSKYKKKLEAKLEKKNWFETVEVKKVEKLDGLPGKYCIKVFKKPEERLNVTTGADDGLQLDKPLTWLPAADGDVRCYANNIWKVKKSRKMKENGILYSSNYGVTWKPLLLHL